MITREAQIGSMTASEIMGFFRLILLCGWGLLTRCFKSQSDKYLDLLYRPTVYFKSVYPKKELVCNLLTFPNPCDLSSEKHKWSYMNANNI